MVQHNVAREPRKKAADLSQFARIQAEAPRPPRVRDGWHAPLADLALCVDCSQVFRLGLGVCPACGTQTFRSLAAILDRPATEAGVGRP